MSLFSAFKICGNPEFERSIEKKQKKKTYFKKFLKRPGVEFAD